MNKNLMDLHTHTIASVHAYSTLRENAKAAKKMGLLVLGVSDHGHGAGEPGVSCPHPSYFTNMKILPEYMEGVRILKGIELNIFDSYGNVFEQDLVDQMKRMSMTFDYTVASIHGNCYEKGTNKSENTRAYLNAMDNPDIDIIGHPDDGNIPSNYDEVMHKAREMNIAIEVNNTSIKPENYRKDSRENILEFLEYGKKYNTLIVLNSDAHIDTEVGVIDLALELVEEVSYPKDLIINYSIESLEKLLGKKEILGR